MKTDQSIVVSVATKEDAPVLAKIGIAALQSDLLSRVIFANPEDVTEAEVKLGATLRREVDNPGAYVLKATCKDEDKIVAYLYIYKNDSTDGAAPALYRVTDGTMASALFQLNDKQQREIVGEKEHWSR